MKGRNDKKNGEKKASHQGGKAQSEAVKRKARGGRAKRQSEPATVEKGEKEKNAPFFPFSPFLFLGKEKKHTGGEKEGKKGNMKSKGSMN